MSWSCVKTKLSHMILHNKKIYKKHKFLLKNKLLRLQENFKKIRNKLK